MIDLDTDAQSSRRQCIYVLLIHKRFIALSNASIMPSYMMLRFL